MQFNVASMLTQTRKLFPDAALLRSKDATYTYAEIDDRSGRFAAELHSRGLGVGHCGAVVLPNGPEFVIAYFGMLKAGLSVIPLNPMLAANEFAELLADSAAVIAVTAVQGVVDAVQQDPRLQGMVLVASGDLSRDATLGSAAMAPFDEFQNPALPVLPPVARDGDETAVVIYTSGTTGAPKGAELGHLQMMLVSSTESDSLGITRDDLILAVLPFFHIFGLSSILHSAVRRGESLYVMDEFSPTELVEAISRHRITLLAGVPSMYAALLDTDWGTSDLSCVRMSISGGAPMPSTVLAELESRLPNMEYVEGYGMSESTGSGTINGGPFPRRVGSIGRSLWGVDLAVVDPAGNHLPPGEDQVGELLMSGFNLMKGYRNQPQATADVIRNGWLHTGDLAYQDEDGYVFIVGRTKDVIIRGGYNVYARDVEEALYQHPDIAEVAVVGRPDDRVGEEVLAFVVRRDGAAIREQDVVLFARERLAGYKYPREVFFVDALPKGPTGKVVKSRLSPLADA